MGRAFHIIIHYYISSTYNSACRRVYTQMSANTNKTKLTGLFTSGFPHFEMKGKCVFLCLDINGNLSSMWPFTQMKNVILYHHQSVCDVGDSFYLKQESQLLACTRESAYQAPYFKVYTHTHTHTFIIRI